MRHWSPTLHLAGRQRDFGRSLFISETGIIEVFGVRVYSLSDSYRKHYSDPVGVLSRKEPHERRSERD